MRLSPEEKTAKIMTWILLILFSIFLLVMFTVIKDFFNTYVNVFTGIGSLAVAFGFPYIILQLRENRKQMRANFSYQIHRDNQEFIKSLNQDVIDTIYRTVRSEDLPKEMTAPVKSEISKILRWYAGVYAQLPFEYINSKQWEVIENNFRSFLSRPLVRSYWDKEKVADNEAWSKPFREWGKKCFKEKGR